MLRVIGITHIVRFLTILDLVALFRSLFYLMIEHLHVVVFPSGALSVMYYFNTAQFIYKSHTVTLRPFLRHNSYR